MLVCLPCAVSCYIFVLGVAGDNLSYSFCTMLLDVELVYLNQQDLLAMMEAEDASREDGTSIAGTLVRLAWHASGTYSKVRMPSLFVRRSAVTPLVDQHKYFQGVLAPAPGPI